MGAKTASNSGSKTKVTKRDKLVSKAKFEGKHEGLLKPGIDSSLVAKAVNALLEHHKKTTDDKLSLLGNDQPLQVQFTLLRTPEQASSKPIRVMVPHPLFKLAESEDDNVEEPEICLIVKEDSKSRCQEMIERFPEHMGCVKKVLGLQSLRKKHSQYQQRRELLNKYNVFMADDRILPMVGKAIGKEFFKAKKQPIPISISRKEALPFAIQKGLSATYMTISKGNCVMIKAGHTGMESEKLVDNIVDITKNAVPKIPRKWANVQVISIKTPQSVALPIYNRTPEMLNELARLSGLEEVTPKEEIEKIEPTTKEKILKKKVKSPLLQALKKVETQKKEEKTDRKKRKTVDEEETNPEIEEVKKSKKDTKKSKKQRKSSEETEDASTKKSKESKDFIASKKWKGSMKGYVFRTGIQGLGYYIDIKPVVDPMVIDALTRAKKTKKKGGRRY